MILTLAQFPKNSTSAPIYRSHLQEIISSFSNPILCFTDDFKSKNRVGFGFSVGDTIIALRHQNPTSSYTAELQAIFSFLEHILATTHSPSPSPFLITSDSLAALLAIAQPYSSHPLVTRIPPLITTFTAISIPVTFIWAPSYQGIPGNENVHSAAKQALLSSLRPRSPSPWNTFLYASNSLAY